MKAHPRAELTEEQVAILEAKLRQARAEIGARMNTRRRDLEESPLRDEPADPGDLAQQSLGEAVTVRLGESERRRVDEIDEALRRMERGTYGICLATDEPIGFDRLLVQPWARFTAAHEAELEAERGMFAANRI